MFLIELAGKSISDSKQGSAIVDLTWGGWHEMKMEAQKNGMPYVRLEGANHQFVKVNKSLFMTFVTFPLDYYQSTNS